MYLKFIGENGSMGLAHGCVYDVIVEDNRGLIWVIQRYFGPSCPYDSPQSFAENWAKP